MNFQAAYNRQTYLDFLQHQLLPEDFELADEKITYFKPDRIKSCLKIADVPSLDLTVFEIEHESENDPRVLLSRETFRLLANYGKQRALVLFTSRNSPNYRLSLVTIDLKWEEGKRPTKEYSNPRRLSFFLGPNAKVHTPQQYLEKRVKDFDDLKKRFSIEVVNKEFYIEIAKRFTELTGGKRKIGSKSFEVKKGTLVFPSPDDTKQKEFAVRLIGRLVFCWFLKKKHLLSEDLLSSQVIKESRNYYHKILEPLFFEVLNTPMETRKEKFKSGLWLQIPFLNGGLFTPHDDDYYKLTFLGESEYLNTLTIPDDWLKKLFEIFETYNFTIDENTPVDIELAIEPEMLGRIFENLLAEINPETGETARKATGSYYTPRPIVEYMVDKSLKQYLLAKTGLPEEKISLLLSYNEEYANLTDSQKDSIIDALHQIKIIDPACGSGAFPMGILQKILLVLQKLDPDSKKWLDKLLSTVPDPMYQKELKRKIDQPSYLHKLGIIKDCIYGVDIQSIAVEISKLRCFLSLIVDEKVDDSKSNRGVEPLPNLEFKFVCANSLIGLSGDMLITNEAAKKIDELKQVRDEYLRSYGNEKKNLESKFLKVRSELSQLALNWQNGSEKALKLADWEPFSHKPSRWFDPGWMFGIRDGFDIVIANPPYIDSEGMVNQGLDDLRRIISMAYTMAKGNWDIYIAFFELSFSVLNHRGVLTFITPDKWVSKPFGEMLRKNKIINLYSVLKAGRKVFESSKVDSIISLFKLDRSDTIKIFNYENNQIVFKREVNKSLLKPPFAFDFLFSDHFELLIKLDAISGKILDSYTCQSACATSDAYKLKPLIKNSSKDSFDQNNELKIINTGTIGRYVSKWGYKEMTYLGDKYLCPVVNKRKFFSVFKNTYAVKAMQSKIIMKGLNLLDACLDFGGNILPGKSTLIVVSKSATELKLLLPILNSRLALFYLKEKYPASSYNEGITFTRKMIDNLPLPKSFKTKQKQFVDMVDKIFAIAQSPSYFEDKPEQTKVKELEKLIDKMVYKLYGLTDEEIAIVEER